MKGILGVVFFGLFSAGSYYWLSRPSTSVPPAHIALVLDASDSMQENAGQQAVLGLLKGGLRVPGIKKGSKLFVSVVGGPATAMEPVAVASMDIPVSNRVMEGRGAVEKERRELVSKVLEEYSSKAIETKCTPVFLAVKRGLDQLHAAGCREKSTCYLFVRSDGEETEEPWIRESISRLRVPKNGAPSVLDNRGIKVRWCGLAETRGVLTEKNKKRSLTPQRSAARSEFLVSVLRSLFSEPDNVIFEPFCPVSEEPAKGAP